jgi:hypothetical protein
MGAENKIVRGTTPALRFNFPFDASEAKTIRIVFKQLDRVVCEKTKDSDGVTVSGNSIAVNLTQIETLKMREGALKVQIRAKSFYDEAIASNVIDFTVENILKGGEI